MILLSFIIMISISAFFAYVFAKVSSNTEDAENDLFDDNNNIER